MLVNGIYKYKTYFPFYSVYKVIYNLKVFVFDFPAMKSIYTISIAFIFV